jgi:hypothetical protein
MATRETGWFAHGRLTKKRRFAVDERLFTPDVRVRISVCRPWRPSPQALGAGLRHPPLERSLALIHTGSMDNGSLGS